MQFGNLKLKHCRYGWMLFYGPTIGSSFEHYGEYSESEVALMRNYIKDGNTVIDVGANIGDLTLPLARMVGEKGQVIAIESQPDNFNVMCGNLALNQLHNVRPYNAFVRGEKDATIRAGFYVEGRTADFISIDSLDLKSCALIKIDVDGNELDVLKSAKETIQKHRPILYFENDVKEASEPLLSYCINDNYDLFWHFAPVCNPNNFFGNTANIFHPHNLISIMVLALPTEKRMLPPLDLIPINKATEWWTDRVGKEKAA